MSITSMPSLDEQIDELTQLIEFLRDKFLPRMVQSGTAEQGEVDRRLGRLDAALITLRRLRREVVG